MFSVYYI